MPPPRAQEDDAPPQTSRREQRVELLPLASQCEALKAPCFVSPRYCSGRGVYRRSPLRATNNGACALCQGRKHSRSRFLATQRCAATSVAAPCRARPRMATAIPSSLDGGARGVKLQAARGKARSCRCSAAAAVAAAWHSAGSGFGARRCCWRSTRGACECCVLCIAGMNEYRVPSIGSSTGLRLDARRTQDADTHIYISLSRMIGMGRFTATKQAG